MVEAATYAAVGHGANYASNWLAHGITRSFHLPSDILYTVIQRSGKSINNVVVRHLYNILMPNVLPYTMIFPGDPNENLASTSYEAGRQALILWELACLCALWYEEWKQTNFNTDEYETHFLSQLRLLGTSALFRSQQFVIAIAYFMAGLLVAGLAKKIGEASRKATAALFPQGSVVDHRRTPNGAEIFVGKEPIKKVYESTFGIPVAMLLKPLVLYYFKEFLSLIKVHQSESTALWEKSYDVGDKLQWSLTGLEYTFKTGFWLISGHSYGMVEKSKQKIS